MTNPDLQIDFARLTPIEAMFGEDLEETQQLTALFEEAELYLMSFGWCKGIRRAYFGLGVSDFIGVFLFEVMRADDGGDRYLWVVAGDIPSAHLSTRDRPNSVSALEAYVRDLEVRCVDSGARDLMRRVALLDTEVLRHYRNEPT